MIDKCERDTSVIKKEIADQIAIEPLLKLDYVAICDPNPSKNLAADLPDLLIAVSIRVGVARLVDNILWSSSGFLVDLKSIDL